MKFFRFIALVPVALILCCYSVYADSIFEIKGDTTGSFTDSSPSSFDSPIQLTGDNGLLMTFTGNGFDVTTDGTGSASLSGSNNLGTFVRSNTNAGNADDDLPFWLHIDFEIPDGIAAGTYQAVIEASIGGPGTPFDIVFDTNMINIPFSNTSGSGSFNLYIDNINNLNKNETENLVGRIGNATFTPSGGPSGGPTAVPEPASLLLIGTGLLGIWIGFHRKH